MTSKSGKNLKAVSSPEHLDEFIHVSNPAIWSVLAAIAVFLFGFLFWALSTDLEMFVDFTALQTEDSLVFYLRDSEAGGVQEGMQISVDGQLYPITSVSPSPISRDFIQDRYLASQYNDLDLVYEIFCEADLPEGYYSGSIEIGSVSPITFLFN